MARSTAKQKLKRAKEKEQHEAQRLFDALARYQPWTISGVVAPQKIVFANSILVLRPLLITHKGAKPKA